MLHLTGYDLPLGQIKIFRQWGSITPCHPERGVTPGVETTTGPLGQGFGNGVGMAISEAHLAARYNRPGFEAVDHFTYGLVSNGYGAYILVEAENGRPEIILIATGSEVSLIVEARMQLQQRNIQARLVSMPSWELFDAQAEEYRRSVFPPVIRARLAVEAGATQGWHRYVGDLGDVVGLDHFGASAPAPNREPEVWGLHMMAVEGETLGATQYETDRARFVGRGRSPRDAVSVVEDRPLSNTVGAVLDPIWSLRARIRVETGVIFRSCAKHCARTNTCAPSGSPSTSSSSMTTRCLARSRCKKRYCASPPTGINYTAPSKSKRRTQP